MVSRLGDRCMTFSHTCALCISMCCGIRFAILSTCATTYSAIGRPCTPGLCVSRMPLGPSASASAPFPATKAVPSKILLTWLRPADGTCTHPPLLTRGRSTVLPTSIFLSRSSCESIELGFLKTPGRPIMKKASTSSGMRGSSVSSSRIISTTCGGWRFACRGAARQYRGENHSLARDFGAGRKKRTS